MKHRSPNPRELVVALAAAIVILTLIAWILVALLQGQSIRFGP